MKKSTYLVSFFTTLLAACGGGGSSDPAPAASVPETTLSPTFGACFELKPGVKFITSNGYKKTVVQEMFNGVSAFGVNERRPNDTNFGTNYWVISGGFVHFLGSVDYDDRGLLSSYFVYSNSSQIPLNMVPGQTIKLAYTSTNTRAENQSVTTENKDSSLTFSGFENLTLGGRVFMNTCKMKDPSSIAGQTIVTWVAQGFGLIARENQDAQGAIIKDSRIELKTIVANP